MQPRRPPPPHLLLSENWWYPPTKGAIAYQPGDFILTHQGMWTSRFIRFGQRLRYRGENRPYAHFNHAAMIVSPTGDLIEATGRGVVLNHIDEYKPKEYQLVRIDASDADRVKAVLFARWSVGKDYGWMRIICIALGLITGGGLSFGWKGQTICSGLVARCMERCGAIFDREPQDMMPADLAKYFDVRP